MESNRQQTRSGGKKKLWLVLAALALAIAAAWTTFLGDENTVEIASVPVKQGEFVIALDLKSGELEAVQAEQINSPQVRGQLKITQLFPEGEQVAVGDVVIEFDKAEFEKRVTEAEQQLEAAKAELEKTEANQKVEKANLLSEIENKKAQLRLAELQVEKMTFESDVDKDEAQLKAKQAKLSLDQANKKLEAQSVVMAAEIRQKELDIAQRQRQYDKEVKDLSSLTVKAEKPGIIVYEKMWKGGRYQKIQVGDEPWGGATLVKLPDLTRMQVKTVVNEVSVDQLKIGQKTQIKLDALPDPTFHGTINSIATLGREKEGDKNVKVFDVIITIDEEDSRLKPGMSASSKVIVQTLPPRPEPDSTGVSEAAETPDIADSMPIFIPLDAVFEKDGRTVVFRLNGNTPVETEVKLGPQNADYVVIEEGLGPDDRVTLRDPTQETDAPSGADGEPSQGVSL